MSDSVEKKLVVYSDKRYELGENDGVPYFVTGGKKYTLSCHPYEPCLYIKDESGTLTAVHNSFDPSVVIRSFADGLRVTSITGREYDAKDFCRMAEYAANAVDIGIDDAERVFPKEKKKDAKAQKNDKKDDLRSAAPERGDCGLIIDDDPFFDVIKEYPDSVVDYCIVRNDHTFTGREAHREALVFACRKLFVDGDEAIWHYNAGRADAVKTDSALLFAPCEKGGKLNYRRAFLEPPYPNNYTDADFDKVNAALFPSGTNDLEVYEWTTDWSEYFDEGREWWGTLCLTVYDESLDRFVVIMASATD